MNAKKWVLTFLLLALVLALGLVAFNYVTDPFAASVLMRMAMNSSSANARTHPASLRRRSTS